MRPSHQLLQHCRRLQPHLWQYHGPPGPAGVGGGPRGESAKKPRTSSSASPQLPAQEAAAVPWSTAGGALLLRGGGRRGPCRDRPRLPRNRQKVPQQTLGFWRQQQVVESGLLQVLLGQPRRQQRAAGGATRLPEDRGLPAAPGGAAVLLWGGGRHDATVQGGG